MSKLHKFNLPKGDKKKKVAVVEARIKHGISEWDVYSLDYYLARVIANGCRMLQKHCFSVPVIMCDGKPAKADDNYTEQQLDAAAEKWKETLETIASGLEVGLEANNNMEEEDSPHMQEFHKAFELFHKYFFNLWY